MLNSLRQYLILMANTGCVESCSGTNTFFQRDIAEEVHPDARWRRVGNTHFTDAQHAAALLDAGVDQIDAHSDGAVELLFRHSWFVKEVLGATGNLPIDNP